jgi:hypothetical protein
MKDMYGKVKWSDNPSGKQNTEKKTDPANENRSLRKQERDKRPGVRQTLAFHKSLFRPTPKELEASPSQRNDFGFTVFRILFIGFDVLIRY